MPLTAEFRRALDTLATACSAYEKATGKSAVLVGGASTTIYNNGDFPSGDFDLVATDDVAFDSAMIRAGFIREDRQGRLMVGYYHPDHDGFGFQQVSGTLFDGRSDPRRLTRIKIRHDASIVMASAEDIIADRLGQHAVATPTDDSRLRQAIGVYRLRYDKIDRSYLERRVREEGGDIRLLPNIVRQRITPPDRGGNER